MAVSWATPKVYVSRVLINNGACIHSIPNYNFCPNCLGCTWPRQADPLLVRMGRGLDNLVQHLGTTNLVFERLSTNFLAGTHR